MKMKKTQSLKLMLLGLFACFGSASAWAQFTAEKGVVYDVSGDKAVVVGVLSTLPDGEFGNGRYLDGTKSIQIANVINGKNVNGFAADWKNPEVKAKANTTTGTLPANVESTVTNADGTQTVTIKNDGGMTTTTVFPTIDATKLTAVELVLRASEITEISRSDMKGLTVAGFILGGTSGITVIPENLFSGVTRTDVPNTARDEHIAYYEGLIGNGTSYVVEDGLYNGAQVYRTFPNFWFVGSEDGKFVVVDENFTQKGANWDEDNYFVHRANAFNAKWKLETEPYWNDVRVSSDGEFLLRWVNWIHQWVPVATKFEGNLGASATPGLQSQADAAKDARDLAYAEWLAADKELTNAKYLLYNYKTINDNLAQNSAKAVALRDAIAAFGTDQWWGELKKQLKKHYTNVPEEHITPWFAAYVLSTTDEADLAPDITKSYWQEKIDKVIATYTDFFGYAPSALKEYYVDGYLFDSYGAVGDIFSHDGLTTVNASSETFTHYTNGVVEDCSGDDQANGTIKIGDKYYFKVKVIQNGIEGWNDKYFYVQMDAKEETVEGATKITPIIDKSAYYVLYEYNPVQLTAAFNVYTNDDFVVTLNGATVWAANYSEKSGATELTLPNGSKISKFVFTISDGTYAGKYAIGEGNLLYSVDNNNNATPVMSNPSPITFTPADQVVIDVPGVEAKDETVQLKASYDETAKKLKAYAGEQPGDQDKATMTVDTRNALNANARVKVGDEYIAVTHVYLVTASQNDDWNGRFYVDADNKLYKQSADDTSASWLNGDNGIVYHVANPVNGNKHTNAVDAVTHTVTGQNTTMVVKIGNKETYKYTLTPETSHADIDSHDPWPAYMAVINANTALDPTKLQTDVDAADKKEKAAADKLDKAELAKTNADKALSDANELLNKAKQESLYIDKYEYESRVDNNDLYEVDFNNDIVTTIGDHAFANCVNAKFNNGTFPATIETVGQEAFLRTLIATADFSKATSEDLTIAADAFKSTPLEVLKLEGTTSEDITPMKVWQIVQNLVKKETLDLEFCVTGETTTVANVNNTLTTVTLPVREDYTQILDGTFYKCWALTSVTIPTQITYIGARAFRYTNVPEFDMTKKTPGTNVKDLAYVGDYAFSKNPSLTAVKFAADAPVNALRANTFQDACALATVEFNDAMEILPEGLFATNVLAKLQLCNTAVKYLPNLFLAGPGEEEGDRQPNTTLTEVCLPDGLLAIDHFALSSCKALTEVDIPGSVFLMGDGVFYNDVNLEKVTIIDSRMIGLPARTFSECEKLSDLVFITLETINPNPLGNNVTQEPFMTETDIQKKVNEVLGYPEFNEGVDGDEEVSIPTVPVDPWGIIRIPVYTQEELNHFISLVQAGQCFGDNIFHGAGIYSTHKFKNNNGVMVPKTLVTVGSDSYMKLIGGSPVYAEAYSKLQAYETKITFTDANKAGDSYWKTYQSKYGTWIKAGQGQIVYSAYQDGNTIILYPAKIKNGYYKIAAYDGTNDQAAASVVRSLASLGKEFSFEQKTNPDQKYQTTLDYENQLSILDQSFTGNSNLNVYYMAVNGTEPQFYKTIESITLPAGWIVFKTEGFLGQGARVVVIDEDDATAVQGVKEYLEGVQTGAIYNLNGVRVSTPQKGQMYIQNGKKFIQK